MGKVCLKGWNDTFCKKNLKPPLSDIVSSELIEKQKINKNHKMSKMSVSAIKCRLFRNKLLKNMSVSARLLFVNIAQVNKL